MKRQDISHPRPKRPSPQQWEDRDTIAPPFALWGTFLLLLLALLAWGITTGG